MQWLKTVIWNKYFSKIIFGILAILFGPLLVLAGAPLVITEIMFNPSGDDTGREWVELYNTSTDTPISLGSAWRFNDGANHLLTLKQGTPELMPGQVAIVTSSSTAFQLTYPNYSGPLFQSTMSLGNTQGSLSVYDGANYLATTTYQVASLNNYQEGKSIELSDVLQPSNWLVSVANGGTPGIIYQAPTSTPTSTPTNLSPVLEVTWPEATVSIGQELNFIASSTDPEGLPIAFNWTFPGLTATSSQVKYSFSNPGSQKVTVTASDGTLATSSEKIFQVNEKEVVATSTEIGPDIVINEILPNPVGDDVSGEWIELYNRGTTTVDLLNWQIKDGTTRRYTITKTDFPESKILANNYFVIPRSISGVVLNNDSDEVYLYRPTNLQVDALSYAIGVEEGLALARNENSWQWTSSPSRGNGNIFTQPKVISDSDQEIKLTVVSAPVVSTNPVTKSATVNNPTNEVDFSNLRINEIMPNPSRGQTEWIELYNNSAQSLNLAGLSLDDQEGGSRPYEFTASSTISAWGYLQLPKSETKLTLNNDRDQVRLLKGRVVLQEVNYEKAKPDQVYAYDTISDEWLWSDQPTPNQLNIFNSQELVNNLLKEEVATNVSTSTEEIDDLAQIQETSIGDKVIIRGVVIAIAGSIGKNKLVLATLNDQDEPILNETVLVSSVSNSNKIKIGDKLIIAGVVKINMENIKYILANKKVSWQNIGIVKNISESDIVSTAEANEVSVYSLVTVEGKVLDKKGQKIILDDGSGELVVNFPTSLKESAKDIRKGEDYKITGVVIRTKDQIKLIPRTISDLVKQQVLGEKEIAPDVLATNSITTVPTDERTGTLKYLLYSLAGVIAAAGSVIIKLKFWG